MFASKWAPPPVAKTSAAAQKESSAAQNLVPDPQALTTPGGVHDPSVIAVFGQYDRMYNENGPSAGAGNQFARWVSAGGFA
jgi:hypothetical protein